MAIGNRKINDIGMMMNWSSVFWWEVTIIVVIKSFMMGGDGLIDNNLFFSEQSVI